MIFATRNPEMQIDDHVTIALIRFGTSIIEKPCQRNWAYCPITHNWGTHQWLLPPKGRLTEWQIDTTKSLKSTGKSNQMRLMQLILSWSKRQSSHWFRFSVEMCYMWIVPCKWWRLKLDLMARKKCVTWLSVNKGHEESPVFLRSCWKRTAMTEAMNDTTTPRTVVFFRPILKHKYSSLSSSTYQGND